jgi:hypothetical protein
MVDEIRLFPELPEDLSKASDEDISQLVSDHEAAIEKINADDQEFLRDLKADEIIAQLKEGVDSIKALRAEHDARVEAHENYKAERERLTSESLVVKAEEDDGGDEGDGDEGEKAEDAEEAAAEVVAEAEAITEETAEEPVLVTASSEPVVRLSRTPPKPSAERTPVPTSEPDPGTALLAAGEMSLSYREPLTPLTLANLVIDAAKHHGVHPKIDPPGKYRFGGPEHKIARAEFDFPEDRMLTNDIDSNMEKIRAVMPATSDFYGQPGGHGGEALVASGGLCAPLTPIYSMPNFGTEAEPVWDSLPKFQAVRGGVNVPAATYVGDITTAISSISEADDALGGTFATKSCQDLTCPAYTETAVQILAHCREYGNLNARAWPEKIAHENALTMQALARTSETFMLEQIKAASVNVTNGLETLGALIYLVDAIVKAAFGIRGRLRMPANARFRALLPSYALDLLLLDTIQTQFDRFRSKEEINAYLRSAGIDPVYYLDGEFAAGDSQLPDAAQTAAALDGFPNTVQWAIFPEGAFLGVDMGTLELGIVRDSTLNSTNDFQVFGERFRNVALVGPAQSAYWVTTDRCPVGQFPPAGTARTCE